jgi:hypothetical protein
MRHQRHDESAEYAAMGTQNTDDPVTAHTALLIMDVQAGIV